MIGEISLGGVYLPALLVLAVIAMMLTWLATRLLKLVGAYRLIAFRPLVELALFVLIFGLVALLGGRAGMQP
jgi:hypothetical protein